MTLESDLNTLRNRAVRNVAQAAADLMPELKAGMVIAIEPMVNAGGPEIFVGEDKWSVFSADGSLTAHFEFTVAITDEGPRILTPWHELID